MKTETKVGDFLWYRNTYSSNSEWKSEEITGETTRSWLIETNSRVNKKTLIMAGGNYSHTYYYTEQGKNDQIWIDKNKSKIERLVGRCNDVKILSDIYELLLIKKG